MDLWLHLGSNCFVTEFNSHSPDGRGASLYIQKSMTRKNMSVTVSENSTLQKGWRRSLVTSRLNIGFLVHVTSSIYSTITWFGFWSQVYIIVVYLHISIHVFNQTLHASIESTINSRWVSNITFQKVIWASRALWGVTGQLWPVVWNCQNASIE